MAKLITDGLLTNPNWHDAPFAGILLGGNNQYNGVNIENPLMIVSVATNPSADETFGIGTKTYTFKDSGAAGDQINLGLTIALTVTAIIAKINADRHNGTGCTAYTLGSTSKILLVDNLSQSHHASPGWTNDGAKVVEEMPWMNTIGQHMLLDFDYFRVPLTDVDTKPITLIERNVGSYQNFLY